jgi:feruloyl esterase
VTSRILAFGALLAASSSAPTGAVPLTAGAPAKSCEELSSLTWPDATMTLARTVGAGAFVAPGQSGPSAAARALPAFCRVAATLTPSSDSDIKVEAWLPSADWNGKFQAVGNGGWAGSIAYAGMMDALTKGYATASTDTGHTGGSASFALGHPEKLIDYAYRSEHEMTVKAKALVAAFYGGAPRLSYWTGCSAGGKQGLMEAQRYPGDFDGIVAGSPAADWTGRAISAIRVAAAIHADEASYIPPAKYAAIHAAVLDACDAIDGVKDDVLENPSACAFDPAVLACKAADEASCLTAPQVIAARAIYASATSPVAKREIPGLVPGSELGWATWGGPQPLGIAYDHFKYVVFKDPAWDFHRFHADTDIARADAADAGLLNALNPDLKPFFDRGGKLIQYHGWSDPQISPLASVDYFRSVEARLGGPANLDASYRLFMVPGMAHCGGGDGPNAFDTSSALEHWVEQRQAPERILASRVRAGQVERTRPLCPYPQVATYDGKGSTDDAGSFSCRVAR